MDRFKLVKEFSRQLTSTLELEELAKVINRFAVVELGAENSSIILGDGRKFSYTGHTRLHDEIDASASKYMLRVAKSLSIAKPSKEFMFKDIKGIELFSQALLCLPLAAKKQALGSLNLYFSKILNDEIMEFISLFAELSSSSIMNSLSYKSVKATSLTDNLTSLSNRRSFDQEMSSQLKKCEEEKKPFSIMMIDIDNFKEYNDTKGHQEGDKILKSIGEAIKSMDLKAFRYGGEEFAVILPDSKAQESADTAESIRKKIEAECGTTVSIGLSTCLNSSCPAEKMISEADSCLYKAKAAGKNRTHSCVIIDKSLSPIDVQVASEVGRT